MKKIANLKELSKQNLEPQKEILLLIGENVWSFYRKDPKDSKTSGEGEGWRLLADSIDSGNPNRYQEIPLILDVRELENISVLELAPPQTEIASLIDTGLFFKVKNNVQGLNIRENSKHLDKICLQIAKTTNIKTLLLRDHLGQLLEDLSGYIDRIRKDKALIAQTFTPEIIELDADTLEKEPPSKKANYFYKWFNQPLSFHPQQKKIYQFEGKCWKAIDDNVLQRKIKSFFVEYEADYRNVENLNRIIACLSVDLPLFAQTDHNLLAFNNGVLNKNTLEFLPHSKDYYLTAFNPCDYLETQTPTPNFDKWLSFISNDDEERKKALLAGLYMILNNRNDWQLTLELIGEPGGGKSIYLEVGKMLSGDDNHEAITLQILNEDKARDIILNKTFLYSSDQAKYIGDASILKQISSGEEVTFNPKNKPPFSTKVKAIIAICSNTLPIYKNDGGGMDRRRVIFPFTRSVDENDRDVNLVDKLKVELGGIIRKIYDTFPQADDALKALFKQKNSKEALELKRENDHILEFIEEFNLLPQVTNQGLVMGSNRGVPPFESQFIYDKLYWCYLLFCNAHGRNDKSILKPSDLMQELKQAFKTAGYKIRFSSKQLGQRKLHTNVIFKDKSATIEKWRNM